MARRQLLVVAAGGVLVGVATLGRGGGRSAHGAQDRVPRPAARARPGTRHPGEAGNAGRKTGAGEPMYYLDGGPEAIALTIDDGPSPGYTPQVLRILEKYRVTASFSMVGQNVRRHPALAAAVAGAGHTIVNHTWNHANLTSLPASRQRAQIDRATAAIQAATGTRPRMFRAPYGAWSRAVLDYCAKERLAPLDWSTDPRDWSRPGVREIVATIMRTTRTGSIILEHDGGGDRSQTVAALNIVIPRLLGEGYRFAVPLAGARSS